MAVSLRRTTWREWLGLAAGLLALGSTFLPWTTLSASRPDVSAALNSLNHGDIDRSAWNAGLFAWGPPLPLLLAGLLVVVLGRRENLRLGGLPHLWLVFAAAMLLAMIIGWFTLSWVFDADQRGLLDAAGVTISAGYGRYLGFAAAIVSAVAAVFDVRVVRMEIRQPRSLRKKAG